VPTTVINGTTIGFDDIGKGDDVLLLIHGHPFDRSMWRPQLTAVDPSSWRVVTPDLRGYGESPPGRGVSTLDVFADDLLGLIDHLGVSQVVIGGLSMGGQIVMEFCRQYLERVRGVLLAATFTQAETDEGRRKRNATADRILHEGMRAYAEELLPTMLASRSLSALPHVADHVLRMMLATNPIGAAAALRGRAERPGYEETLARVDVPAAIVVGSEDAYSTRDDAAGMARLLRRSELTWLEDVGHMPNLEAETEFNRALGRLLERVAFSSDDR
jgi:pimeloyl-ACP methyl ester carboxylesterase